MDKLEVVGWARRPSAEHPLFTAEEAVSLPLHISRDEPLPEAGEQPEWFVVQPLTPHAPAQAEIDRLREEVAQLEANLRTVQNAAKTLHAARDTELQHLRENAAFDHKLRQEHQSLIDRDALMTDALLAAEARALAAEAEVSRLTAEREKDREALEEAERTFRWYGDLHAAKPDAEKAQRNYDLADRMAAALARAKERKPDIYWDRQDTENGAVEVTGILYGYAPGEIVELSTAYRGPTMWGVYKEDDDGKTTVFVSVSSEEVEAWLTALQEPGQ